MPRYTRFMHDNSQTAALWDDAALADAARFDSIEERLARIEAHQPLRSRRKGFA